MSDTKSILTLSHGDFSCRLEGFDNPYQALTAIGEHLGDLARKTVVFDAMALNRLVEATTPHQVEPQMRGNQLVLRATPRSPDPAKPAKGDASPAPTAAQSSGPASQPAPPGAGDPRADRLFAATENRLRHTDSTRRRANIEHLKAAVAARDGGAPKGTHGAPSKPNVTAHERKDLPQITPVRRYRVDVTNRPQSPRLPPLVLVSDQRIDVAPPAAGPSQTPGHAPGAADLQKPAGLRVSDTAQTGQIPAKEAANSLARLMQKASTILHHPVAAQPAGTGQDALGALATKPQIGADPVDHGCRFARRLEQSDAIDIEEVIELAADYTMAEFGTATLDRAWLFAMIAEATDHSISHDDMLKAFGHLVRIGRLSRVARGSFRLMPGPGAEPGPLPGLVTPVTPVTPDAAKPAPPPQGDRTLGKGQA